MRGVGAPDKRSSAPRSEGCGSAHFPRVLRPIAHPRPLPLSVITPNYCLRARRVWANVSAESNYDIPTRSGPGVLLLVSGDEGPRRANRPVCFGKKDNIIRIGFYEDYDWLRKTLVGCIPCSGPSITLFTLFTLIIQSYPNSITDHELLIVQELLNGLQW